MEFGPHLILATLEGAVTAAVLALTACSSSAGFEKDDPEAHSACTKFLVDPVMEDVADDEEIVMVLGTALAVGEHASKATTPEIQATAEDKPIPESDFHELFALAKAGVTDLCAAQLAALKG